MMRAVGTAGLVSFAAGQQAGTLNDNYLMPMTLGERSWTLQGQQACIEQAQSLSLDSNWRWTHQAGSTTARLLCPLAFPTCSVRLLCPLVPPACSAGLLCSSRLLARLLAGLLPRLLAVFILGHVLSGLSRGLWCRFLRGCMRWQKP